LGVEVDSLIAVSCVLMRILTMVSFQAYAPPSWWHAWDSWGLGWGDAGCWAGGKWGGWGLIGKGRGKGFCKGKGKAWVDLTGYLCKLHHQSKLCRIKFVLRI
jgi:hypothetical protein